MVWKEPGKDKDPWDSGEQRSPDLEKLVDSLHKRLTALFGGGRRRGRRKYNQSALWLIPLFLILWLISGCYVVDAGDRGVNYLFGCYRDTVTPGLNWHLPWPLGSDEIVAGVDAGADYVRGYPSLVTADGNAVSIEVSVHYQIVNLPQYLFANANPGDGPAAGGILAKLTDAAVSAAVAHAGFTDMFGGDLDSVESTAHEQLLASLRRYDTGLAVSRLELHKLYVPPAVVSAYAAVHQAQDDSRKQVDEAQAYAGDLLPRTHGEADARIAAANAYATEVVQRATGDAAAFGQLLPAYRRAPAVTRESLFLDTFEQILKQVDKVVVLSAKGRVTLSFEHPGQQVPAAATAPAKPKASSGGGH